MCKGGNPVNVLKTPWQWQPPPITPHSSRSAQRSTFEHSSVVTWYMVSVRQSGSEGFVGIATFQTLPWIASTWMAWSPHVFFVPS